jgi:hypothetical protein
MYIYSKPSHSQHQRRGQAVISVRLGEPARTAKQVYASQSKVKELTDANLWNIFYDRNKVVVVHFWADSCRACDGVAKVMASLPDRYSKGPLARLVKFYHVQWDPKVNPRVHQRFGFKSIPLIFFYYTATGRPPANIAPLLEGSLGGDRGQYDPNQYIRRIKEILRKHGHVAPAHATPHFRSAEDRIYEDDFEAVLAVLAGASPWQEYIRDNLRVARRNLPRRPFRIVSSKEFAQTLGRGGDVGHAAGVTDKRTGIITMLEFFGVNSRATFLGAALHETVHLVSHPAGRGRQPRSTAWPILGEGLLEGLVECITGDILSAQGIALARPDRRGHQQRAPVARELLRTHGVPLLARVLFAGDFRQFLMVMNHMYSVVGWTEIKRLTTANNPARAIQRMNELRAVEEQRRPKPKIREFQWIFR